MLMALTAGVLVVVSRSVNGRLSLSTSPLQASFWNHIVGAAAIIAIAIATGQLIPPTLSQAPWFAWAGGTVGVIFIALGSYVVARIGAAMTAMLVIAGQMISGVALDVFRDVPGPIWPKVVGVLLILSGMWLSQRRRTTS